MAQLTASNNYIYSYKTGRGLQVKQKMKCLTHNTTFIGMPSSVIKSGVGCETCKIDLALNGIVFSPWSEAVASAYMKTKSRFSHVLYKYCGRKTGISIFICDITGKKFRSTVQTETVGGKTGCLHCKDLLEVDRRRRTQSTAFDKCKTTMNKLHEKNKYLSVCLTDKGLVCNTHGLFRPGWKAITKLNILCKKCHPRIDQKDHRKDINDKGRLYIKDYSNLYSDSNNMVHCKIHHKFIRRLSWFLKDTYRNCLMCIEDNKLKLRLEKLHAGFPNIQINKVIQHSCFGITFINNCGYVMTWHPYSNSLTQQKSVEFKSYTIIESPAMLTSELKSHYIRKILEKHPTGINVKFNVEPTNKMRIKCRHTCGHIWETHIHNLLASKIGCPLCGRKQAASATRLKSSVITKRLISVKSTFRLLSQTNSNCELQCSACGTIKSTASYIAHKTPCGCIATLGPRSKIAFCWLADIQKIYNIELQGVYGTKEKSLKLDGHTIRVDGYHKETKTVFEFLGDYYHGNPKVYPKKKDLYIKSLGRFANLNHLGYNVVYVWEHDYKKLGQLSSGYLQGLIGFTI